MSAPFVLASAVIGLSSGRTGVEGYSPRLPVTHAESDANPTYPIPGHRGGIRGEVLRERGDPLAGWRIHVEEVVSTFGVPEIGVTTGRDGSFEYLLFPGRYIVEASGSGDQAAAGHVVVTGGSFARITLIVQSDGD